MKLIIDWTISNRVLFLLMALLPVRMSEIAGGEVLAVVPTRKVLARDCFGECPLMLKLDGRS